MEQTIIELDTIKPMSKWGLFFWRFKRLFSKMGTIQVEIPDEKLILDLLCKYEMSPSELISYACEQYLKDTKNKNWEPDSETKKKLAQTWDG